MCKIYSSTPPADYAYATKSVRLNGAVTSIRLEQRFWCILERLAEDEGATMGRFLSTLYDEAVQSQGRVDNFASLLRVVCTTYLGGEAVLHGRARHTEAGAEPGPSG
ncbi:MAG: ribbon-helix-helix domain-containing protein [Oceanidesulfovibrio sp.]